MSQAVRAFWLSGQKAQFNGLNTRNEKQFKTVSTLQEKTARNMRSFPAASPGSSLDFKVAPTITAIGPLSNIPVASATHEPESLNNTTVMTMLSVDFARALKDLAMIMNDLQKLSSLGDLSLSLPNSSTLRVRFPGCDADTVNRLCEELGIRRGLVYQDEDFDSSNGTEIALLFPFAPSHAPSEITCSAKPAPRLAVKDDSVDWQNMLSPQQHSSPKYSIRSMTSHDSEGIEVVGEHPWLSSPSGYSSLGGSDEGDAAAYFGHGSRDHALSSSDYEGLEGIYRFLEECDRARR